MELFFLPLACSIAPRIVADEQGVELRITEIDRATKKTADGEDYTAVNPLGQVPALRLEDGEVLTENVAILDYLSGLGGSELTPRDAKDRTKILRWLGFINSELHAIVFHYLLTDGIDDAAKDAAIAQADDRLKVVSDHLDGRDFLLDRFTAPDAYLFIVLTWANATGVGLTRWPVLSAYRDRLSKRPSIARAMQVEAPLYRKRATGDAH